MKCPDLPCHTIAPDMHLSGCFACSRPELQWRAERQAQTAAMGREPHGAALLDRSSAFAERESPDEKQYMYTGDPSQSSISTALTNWT